MPITNAKVLVVEDDMFLAKILSTKLEKEGFSVVLAFDGEEALNKLKKEIPDLILLDLILPKKNGFEVLEEIKLDDKLNKIPVIILSNLGQQSDVVKGKELGAVDYLIKANFSLDEVISKIKEHLIKAKDL